MIEAIIFDFDGVIVDSEPLHCEAFRRAVEPEGVTFDYAFYEKEMLGFDDRDAFRYLAKEFNAPLLTENMSERVIKKADIFVDIVKEGVKPCADSPRIVKEAHDEYKIAIASGALFRDIDVILNQLEDGSLKPLFQTVVAADMVKISKPHPETYAMAAERIGVKPEHCMAIEDTPHGISSAKDAGMAVVAVAHTYDVDKLKESRADLVISSFQGTSIQEMVNSIG